MSIIEMNVLILEPLHPMSGTEIRGRGGARVMLVTRDGQEEVILPPTPKV